MLIPHITESMLGSNAELLNLYVPEILRNDYSVTLSVSLLIIVMEQSQPQTRKQILLKYFALFVGEVKDLLAGLGEKYSEIQSNGETVSMKLTDLDLALAKKLKEGSIIADWKTKKDELFLINYHTPENEATNPAE